MAARQAQGWGAFFLWRQTGEPKVVVWKIQNDENPEETLYGHQGGLDSLVEIVSAGARV